MIDEDDSNEENENEVDATNDEIVGNPKYKSRLFHEGQAAGVMTATGQAYHISLQQDGQANKL